MSDRMRFHALLEPAQEGGFTGRCVEIPGAISEGDTPEEVLMNIRDAIRAVLGVRLAEAQAKLARGGYATHSIETVEMYG